MGPISVPGIALITDPMERRPQGDDRRNTWSRHLISFPFCNSLLQWNMIIRIQEVSIWTKKLYTLLNSVAFHHVWRIFWDFSLFVVYMFTYMFSRRSRSTATLGQLQPLAWSTYDTITSPLKPNLGERKGDTPLTVLLFLSSHFHQPAAEVSSVVSTNSI